MIRTCGDGERSAEIETAIIDRAAADDARDAVRRDRLQGVNVSLARDPATGDDGERLRLCERVRRFEIDALQEPIAADIGEQHGGDARVLEPAGEIGDRHV